MATTALTQPSWYDHSAILDRNMVRSSKSLQASFVELLFPRRARVLRHVEWFKKGSRNSGTAEDPHMRGKMVDVIDAVVFHVGKTQQVGRFPGVTAQIRVVHIHPTA